ncbi:PIG-L family deacetylase [Puniceicoccaceae bacterium K14]|nr:PIG-L family deacetylase [Puniceicoccaceae bacterium K14]
MKSNDLVKRMLSANMNGKRILVFGAHPDDIEFGCGPFLIDAAEQGAHLEWNVLSRGEAGTQGDAKTREAEARAAAALANADIRFPETKGDTQIRADREMVLLAASAIRRFKPHYVLAPTGHLNQHPDHRETSLLVRDAFRLARYGKTPGLEDFEPHSSQLILFYEITSGATEDSGLTPFLLDVSGHIDKWTTLMNCHASQVANMDYVELQLAKARALGIQAGVGAALRLYSEGPLLLSSVNALSGLRGQRF